MIRNIVGNFISRYSMGSTIRNIISDKFPSYFYFRSYSQWGEDSVISQFLHSKTGSYIDIGSGHPIKGNNTYFLYQRGWTGILIDPILHNSKLSKKYRHKDVFYKTIVSNKNGNEQFWEFRNYGLSTSDPVRASLLLKQGEALNARYDVTAISLNEILNEYLATNNDAPELLSVDVEGLELQVLESNDWNIFKPKVICIEVLNNDLQKEIFNNSQVFLFLSSRGYNLRASVGNSQIFVRKI
jgi:FkbM family methyltransferase